MKKKKKRFRFSCLVGVSLRFCVHVCAFFLFGRRFSLFNLNALSEWTNAVLTWESGSKTLKRTRFTLKKKNDKVRVVAGTVQECNKEKGRRRKKKKENGMRRWLLLFSPGWCFLFFFFLSVRTDFGGANENVSKEKGVWWRENDLPKSVKKCAGSRS